MYPHPTRLRGAEGARVIQVIETKGGTGTGLTGDDFRSIRQYWSLDGELLAVNDPFFFDLMQPCLQYDGLIKELKEVADFFGYTLSPKQSLDCGIEDLVK